MAETPNLPNINLPQRTITITGMMTARLFQLAIRASRIDIRSMQVAMAPPSVRDPSNRAVDRLLAAVSRFEQEMSLAETELEVASNNRSNRRGNAQPASKQRQGRDARPQSGANAQSTAPKPAAANGQDSAAESSAKPRPRNRNKNKGNAGGGNAQAAPTQQQAATQNKEATPKGAANPAKPKPAQDAVNNGASDLTTAPAPVPATLQVAAPQADVAATIQAL